MVARSWARSRLLRVLAPLAPVLAAGALGGCSAVDTLNRLEPKGGLSVSRDIPFTTGPRGKLDVYAPQNRAPGRPVVVFFYGGNWEGGEKDAYTFAGAALASRGYVVVLPDYRVYPEVRWPAFLEDGAKAVRWARDHAAEYGGDPSRMVLMGHSAGAYNAAMLALDRRWLGAVGMKPDADLKGVVGLAGPYDFLPLESEVLKSIFGPEEARPATQPVQYVTAAAPPLLLLAPEHDNVVDPGNNERLARRVRAVGGRAEVKLYPGINHALAVGALAAPLRWMAPILRDAADFIDRTAGAAK